MTAAAEITHGAAVPTDWTNPNENVGEKLNELASRVTGIEAEVVAARKSADESISSDSTFSDDRDLVLALPASKTYIVTGMIFLKTSSFPDFKYEWGGPSGATIKLGMNGGRDRSTNLLKHEITTAFNQSKAVIVTSSSVHMMPFSGIVTIDTTAGNLVFRWAQNFSDLGPTIVEAGSWLRAETI